MQSTTKLSFRTLRPIINGYVTFERSFRVTWARINFGPMQNVISTTGLRSLKSALRMFCQSTTGKRSHWSVYFLGNLNSAMLFFTLSSLASREDVAAPVSMRAGNLTRHGIRMTSSTSPIVILSPAVPFPVARRKSGVTMRRNNRAADAG